MYIYIHLYIYIGKSDENKKSCNGVMLAPAGRNGSLCRGTSTSPRPTWTLSWTGRAATACSKCTPAAWSG